MTWAGPGRGRHAFFAAPLVVLVGVFVVRVVERRLSNRLGRRGYDDNLVQLIRRSIWVVNIIVLVLLVLSILNVPLGAFAFISGAIAIGVGFGAQNIINNFISGWILMGERPIRIGDIVEFQGMLGRVEAINTRSTRIRRFDGIRVVTPNSVLLENTVVNWTLMDNEIRSEVRVGVAYGSPVRQVKELIEQAAGEQDDVMEDPPLRVLFQDFGESALIFDLFFWTQLRPGADLRRLRSDIRFRIVELFREAGITIAFPQRDVHLDGELRLINAEAHDAAKLRTDAPVAHQDEGDGS